MPKVLVTQLITDIVCDKRLLKAKSAYEEKILFLKISIIVKSIISSKNISIQDNCINISKNQKSIIIKEAINLLLNPIVVSSHSELIKRNTSVPIISSSSPTSIPPSETTELDSEDIPSVLNTPNFGSIDTPINKPPTCEVPEAQALELPAIITESLWGAIIIVFMAIIMQMK